ncbi:lytic transglycosylase domain-containing protein [Lachnospiraceae bacterium 62-35]
MSIVTAVSDIKQQTFADSVTSAKTEATGGNFKEILKSASLKTTESMDSIFEEASQKYNVPLNLIKAVAKTESGFNPRAVSKSGAMGVMQLMPSTARSLGVTDPFDARQNIMGGAKCLRDNLDRYNGNISLSLAAYNAGPGAVSKYGGVPPYAETQNYVKKVTSFMNGEPLKANKFVATGGPASSNFLAGASGSSKTSESIFGQYASLNGLQSSSNQYRSLGISQESLSQYAAMGLSQSGIGSPLLGLNGYTGSQMGSFLGGLAMSEDGETITMDKESFASLVQILRLQMMMNASQSVGSIVI